VKAAFYTALLVITAAIVVALISSPPTRPIGIIAAIMLVVGSGAALIWWRLADSLFPGATEKTGQRIGPGGKRGRPVSGTVIKGFESTPGEPPVPSH
jgi:hypothetical protein